MHITKWKIAKQRVGIFTIVFEFFGNIFKSKGNNPVICLALRTDEKANYGNPLSIFALSNYFHPILFRRRRDIYLFESMIIYTLTNV